MIVCPTCQRASEPGAQCTRCFSPLPVAVFAPHVHTYAVRGLGIAAVVAMAFALLVDLATSLAAGFAVDLVGRGEPAKAGELYLLLAVVSTLPLLVAGVLVIIWLWRARKNLDVPTPLGRLGAGWAIGAWWIPVANIFLTGSLVQTVARETIRRNWAGSVAIVWCIAFWVSQLIHRVAPDGPDAVVPTTADYVDFFQELQTFDLISTAALAVAGVALSAIILASIRTRETEQIGSPA